MKAFLIVIFSILMLGNTVIAQQYKWVKGGGTNQDLSSSPHNEGAYYMCTDPNGNTYSLCVVGNTAIIADTFYRSSAYGGSNNIFITSYNCSGQMRWAKLIGSANGCVELGIAVDRSGHVYVAGDYTHVGGSHTLYIGYDSTFSTDQYKAAGVIQFDTSGHLNWLRFIGANTSAGLSAAGIAVGSLTLDRQQNLHFVKLLKSGVQITPTVLSTYGTYDIVYDPSGNILNATRLQLDSTQQINGISIDTTTSKLYVYGGNNEQLTSTGGLPSFAAAFDINRNLLWQDTMFFATGGSGAFEAIIADGIGHLYLTGAGWNGCYFNGDTITNAPYSSGSVAFVMKTDTSGNPKWIRRFSTDYPGQNYIAGLTLMPNGKLAATGSKLGTVASGTDTIFDYSGEGYSNYFTILDTAGYVHELKQIHGIGNYDAVHCIASDKVGNLYIGGDAANNMWGGSLTPYTSVGGNTDFFVMKYGVDCSCTGMPMASFTHSGNPTVTFTYTGTVTGIDSVRWLFGDGGTSTSFSPVHSYLAPGTYTVRVNIYSACGNDSRFTTITVICVAPPVSNFTSTGITATRNFTYTGTAVALDSVVWNFGDGGHAVGLTAAHTYAAIGSYNVCVTAYNPCGSHTYCNTVVVTCVNHLTAAFTHTGFAPMSFTYTGTTTGMDSVVWHYGDGGHGTGTTSSHNYPAIGTYTACVLAYNHCGVDSTCSTFTLPCVVAPTASFTSSGVTATRNFTYTGTTVALDSVTWDFGDGGHAIGLTPSHTYATTGAFTACVTAYSPCGSNTNCSFVNVTCITAPTASFTNTGSPSVTFNYTGTTTGLDSVVWNFGDGGHGSGPALIHPYAAVADTYTVCVTAYNQCGWDSVCSDVIVTCPVPVASFTISGNPAITFNYTGTTPAIDSIVWDFNDGSFDTGIAPIHSYTASGTYHVCVIVYSHCGSDTTCVDVNATGLGITSLPLANIQVYPNPATDELNITGIPAITNYRLLSVTGVSLQLGILQKGSNSVLMKNYAPGIYLMELIGMDGSRNIVRIVKQ